MRTVALGLIGVALVALVWTACTGDDPQVSLPSEGGPGQKCFEDNTCHQGLTCAGGLCQPIPDATTGSSSSGGAVGPDADDDDDDAAAPDAGKDAGQDAAKAPLFDAGPDAASCQLLGTLASKFPRCPKKALSVETCGPSGAGVLCCPGDGCTAGGTGCPGYAQYIECFGTHECGSKKCCLAATVDAGTSCTTSLTVERMSNEVPSCMAQCGGGQLQLCDQPGSVDSCPAGKTCRAAAIDLPNARRQVLGVCLP